ncbi:SpaA isopeptide-forming pilin-related protein [Streptomyces sp. BH055]|uniref:SpaA isopeptide-forming pilin-related protein n=1 Tax=Streptomyces sp. BH055 TaxID=3401173 RepID=UPI003BB605AF
MKTGGDRDGDATVAPLAGVRLALYDSESATTPVSGAWAQCTSDGDGDCNTDARVESGTYTLSESGGPEGYDGGDWACEGPGGALPVAAALLVAAGTALAARRARG